MSTDDFYDQMSLKWRTDAYNRTIEDMAKAIDNVHQKEVKINKKDAVGATKASTDCIPSAAIFALGAAMADGGKKYDPYNYRDSQVKASVFHNAMNRHHWDWWEGEDYAPDSLVHHLGHLMACCAIILDAISVGNFVDDRPKTRIEGASRRTQVWRKENV